MNMQADNDLKSRINRRLVGRLAGLAVAMFGFGYAMVPLYGVFCDITGLGGRSVQISENADGVADSDREVQIRFLATTHSDLPWQFQPVEKTSTIKLGELSETRYLAMNPTAQDMIGQATYNVVPPEASLYFVKTECFCFTEQLLTSNESREMPVYFFVQPDLPESIKEITLSYTFYRNEKAEKSALALASANAPVTEN
ncbi:MAG TPA: cytochrome c oxidase assembly protein [Xanthomonadales bacterium]|nr:cytochrome c oxidase assembly protein [Xanthomonadales bacterium]